MTDALFPLINICISISMNKNTSLKWYRRSSLTEYLDLKKVLIKNRIVNKKLVVQDTFACVSLLPYIYHYTIQWELYDVAKLIYATNERIMIFAYVNRRLTK